MHIQETRLAGTHGLSMSLALFVFSSVVVAEGCCFKPTVTVTALFLLLHFRSHRPRSIIRDGRMNIKYVVLREYN